MNLCEKLLAGCISADCANPIYTGIDSTAYIFNKSEISSFTVDAQNPNLITAITMAEVSAGVTATGFKIQQFGKQPFTGTTTSMAEGNISNKFNAEVHFTVPDNCPNAASIIDNLANGKFVVVLVNDYEGSDGKGKYQVFGSKKGLTATAIDGDKYSEDTDGGWAVTLTEENTPMSAMFIRHETTPGTDDTKSYLDSLVSCS